jgi:hypothetical protein
MKYLENFNSYDVPNGKEPILDSVNKWMEFLDKRYPISDFRNMKTIQIEDKMRFLSGSFLTKKRLTDQIFYDIKTDEEMQGSEIHEPSLRKAIKEWIDKYSKLNESLESFDVDFAITKIKEQFPFDKVKEMLDKEVLEWDEDSSSYYQLSNGEAENAIIIYLMDWYSSKYPSSQFFSSDDEYDLSDAIQKEYNFLKY